MQFELNVKIIFRGKIKKIPSIFRQLNLPAEISKD